MKYRFQKDLRKSMTKSFITLQVVMILIFMIIFFVSQGYRKYHFEKEIVNYYQDRYQNEMDEYQELLRRSDERDQSQKVKDFIINNKIEAFSKIEVVVFNRGEKLNETFEQIDYRRDYFLQLLLVSKDQYSTYYNRSLNLRVIYFEDQDYDLFLFVDLSYLLPSLMQYRGIISDEYGNTILSNFHLVQNLRLQNELAIPNYEIKKSVIDQYTYVYSVVEKENLFEIYLVAVLILFGFSYTTFMVIRLYINRLIIQNTKSLEDILTEIQNIQDNKQEIIKIKSEDDFQILIDKFNDLLIGINQLNYRNQELAKLESYREIKQLEAQFQPHFLYNTLDAIKYSIHSNPNQAIELIYHLTSILRYSINTTISKSYLEEDIEYVKSFLEINQIRLQDQFSYDIDVKEKYKKLPVPKLLLQPLIENSIKYVYRKNGKVSIKIEVRESENYYILKVKDSGNITDEKIKELNQYLIENKNELNHHGLYLTHRRVQLFYGNLSYLVFEKENETIACIYIHKTEVIQHV